MGWDVVTLIVTMTVTLVGFLWGIIRLFKKEDKSWEAPLKEFKKDIEANIKKFKLDVEEDVKEINEKITNNSNAIHDLEKDSRLTQQGIADLKTETSKVSDKCDKILDKVIEFISKD